MLSNWLDVSSSSNRYKQMYIKGFLDISGGDLIIRNNNLYLLKGDASINGNLNVQNTANIDKITVQDISINGNLRMTYHDNSIPSSAIIGGLQSDSGIFNMDVSMNTRLNVDGIATFKTDVYVGGDIHSRNGNVNAMTLYENDVALSNKYASTSGTTFTGMVNANAGLTILSGQTLTVTGTNIIGLSSSSVGLDNVDNTSDSDKPVSSYQYAALELKADINSPSFTGIPEAPTASAGANTAQIATTAYVRSEIASLVNSAPEALNTLNELAIALGGDEQFSTTVATNIGLKANIANPIFTGTANFPNAIITSLITNGDASFNTDVFIAGDMSLNTNLAIGGNINVNGEMIVKKYCYFNDDISLNNHLDISGSLITHTNINVYGVINQQTLNLDDGYITTYDTNSVADIGYLKDIVNIYTSNNNTIIGKSGDYDITSGSNNTIVGYHSGSSLTTGSNNLILGSNAEPSTSSSSNEITLGDSSITTLRCAVQSLSSLSDIRDKKNIDTIPTGLDFINKLNPVRFDWNMRDGGKIDIADFGFIAQELKTAEIEIGISIPNLVHDSNPDKLEASYGALIPVMVKSIQDLYGLIQEMKTTIESQQQEIKMLKTH